MNCIIPRYFSKDKGILLIKRIFTPRNILICFVAVMLLSGLFIAPDFGSSTDESNDYKRSQFAYEIYSGAYKGSITEGYQDLDLAKYYGTSSGMVIRFIEQVFFPNAENAARGVAHYFYFVYFQLAIVAMFFLAKQLLNEWVSLGVAVLFGTQPLFFGHAFINPKDIPMLVVFLGTVVLGFRMVDGWQFGEDRPVTKHQQKEKTILITAVFAIFLLFWFQDDILQLILYLVERAYTAKGSGIFGKLFEALTTSGSLEGYLILTEKYFWIIVRWAILITPLILLVLFFLAERKHLTEQVFNLTMLSAAAIWGFALSTRVFAFAAGGMIVLYGLIRWKQKAILPLLTYTLTAAIFSYITWPFLWVEGFSGLIKAMTIFQDFPWEGKVLFNSAIYPQNTIPANYIPKLMALQFTEPLVILAILGFSIGIYRLFKGKIPQIKVALLYCWFLLPILYTMIRHPTLYSNFRQFFFVTPPLFIFAGYSIQWLTDNIKKSWFLFPLYGLIFLPGVYQLIHLHPYQYLYYNSFIGGVSGAAGKYELDYWNLAYKEAMGYVNEEVPEGSRILVWKNNLLGEAYAEKEFIFKAHTSVPESEYPEYDYAILPIVWHADISAFEDYPVVYRVQVDSVDLVIVVKLTDQTAP